MWETHEAANFLAPSNTRHCAVAAGVFSPIQRGFHTAITRPDPYLDGRIVGRLALLDSEGCKGQTMTSQVRNYPRTTLWIALSGYLMLIVEALVK